MILKSTDHITQILLNKNIQTWQETLDYIQALPYGRNASREDLSLVLKEEKGTCSSKHALLKKIAELNQFQEIDLILGMYKMTEKNTPGIGEGIAKNNLEYIPEAHCYLKINNQRLDVTNMNSDIQKLENDIIKEISILPEQVSQFKVEYHQDFIKKWIVEKEINYSFEEVWAIREKCIQNLSNNH